ncbi:conjugal transfer protein TraC [Patescibacteria group bacterium]|nr:conjugal transfer protein TraC [Patescibacteria group bacterium]MBU1673166.1 conjugal transfer protein TraC [Patescibacteria group bacterium]MBU1964149.1 conjugal transfer protein TraC [Patescibacteria group bacterium]
MAKKEMASSKKKVAPSTVKYLPFQELKEDTVVMKDGSLRAVYLVSSLNFALKSEDEQQAIISGYVSFLNSVNFPIQVIIQSRKLDITKYLAMLAEKAKAQTNELLKIQTQEYKQYISELVSLSDIMEKKFFVVVPYSSTGKGKQKNFIQRFNEAAFPGSTIHLSKTRFEKYKTELDRRASLIEGGLGSIGLKLKRLDTRGLIELYYESYNPTRHKSVKMPDIDKIQIEGEIK